MAAPETRTAARTAKRNAGALAPEEQAVVARLSGGFGWPTVVFAVALLAIEVGVIALWAGGVVPLAIGVVINSLVSYAWYTVHHDATHKAISGRDPRWRRLEVACGHVAGFALQLEFRGYAANHLRHHAHTNTPADPDLAVKGPLWQVPLKWAVAMVLVTIGALPFGDRVAGPLLVKLGLPASDSARERSDRNRQRRLGLVELVALLATIPFGAFRPAFFLVWLPGRFGILLLMVLFQWLPHFPFDRTDRFGATRVNRFPGSTWLLLQQDRHLIHHLYPSIPWYRYRAAHRELGPFLAAKGAIIEGRGTSPHVPIRLRETA